MPKAVKNRVSSNDRTFIKKMQGSWSVPELFPKQMQICIWIFQFPMILVNIATTLFPGILFQLFVPCILLSFSLNPDLQTVGEFTANVKKSLFCVLIAIQLDKVWDFWLSKLILSNHKNSLYINIFTNRMQVGIFFIYSVTY